MNADEADRRISELEEQLRRAREEATRYKKATLSLLTHLIPEVPLTDEELKRMLTDTSGAPILDIVAELERTGS